MTRTVQQVVQNILANLPSERPLYKEQTYEQLKPTSWGAIIAVPFLKRALVPTQETMMTILVKHGHQSALFGQTIKNIARESYGNTAFKRPAVAFVDRSESLQKGMWFYEHRILPLLLTPHAPIAKIQMEKYQCDSFVGSNESLYMYKTSFPESVKHVYIIDSHLNLKLLCDLVANNYKVSFVLALPEAGALGNLIIESLTDSAPVFTTHDSAYLEHGRETLVTKLYANPTPILKYKTNFHTEPAPEHSGSPCFKLL